MIGGMLCVFVRLLKFWLCLCWLFWWLMGMLVCSLFFCVWLLLV